MFAPAVKSIRSIKTIEVAPHLVLRYVYMAVYVCVYILYTVSGIYGYILGVTVRAGFKIKRASGDRDFTVGQTQNKNT